MKTIKSIISLAALLSLPVIASAQTFKLNDLEYFEERGANVLVYSNIYNGGFCDEKLAGIEIIQRGERFWLMCNNASHFVTNPRSPVQVLYSEQIISVFPI